MKNSITTLLVTLLVGGMVLSMSPADAQQTDTREKIRLMREALEARDGGDLELAKERLEELLRLSPDEQNVQRMLNSVNQDLARVQEGEAPVFGQAAEVTEFSPSAPPAPAPTAATPAAPAPTAPTPAIAADADALLKATAQQQKEVVSQAREVIKAVDQLAQSGRYDEAYALLESTEAAIPVNTATVRVLDDLQKARANVIFRQSVDASLAGDLQQAQVLASEYYTIVGQNSREARRLRAMLSDPGLVNIQDASADFIARQQKVDQLLLQGRAQYLYGDYEGALQSFGEVEAIQPDNREAKAFQMRIGDELNRGGYLDYAKTRAQMLEEVNRAWQRPKIFQRDIVLPTGVDRPDPIREKLRNIQIPRVSFSDVPLRRVVETLSEYSVEFDPDGQGVNIVLVDQRGADERVTITLRNFSLEKVLGFVTQSIGFQYDVEDGAVVIRRGEFGPDGPGTNLITDFFPISRGTVIRLTGLPGGTGGGGGPVDPFAPPSPAMAGPTTGDETEALRAFFERAGVNFTGVQGANLAFDGTQLIVTQTPRNMERLRNILRRYDTTEQVEIEAKFLEVQQGALEELGFNWAVNVGGRFQYSTFGATGNNLRNLESLAISSSSQSGSIVVRDEVAIDSVNNTAYLIPGFDIPLPNNPPTFPGALNLGVGTVPIANIIGAINGTDIQMVITALEQQTGSDLMSAPKLTVLNGKTAEIVVAQELRYPTSYSDIQSEVGSRGTTTGTTGGSAGVTITAGTPQDFETRRIGVEMEVTPTVEDGDKISLRLEPRVTEFEGFVEYGGISVAISGGTTVTVPSGFFQPIFSVRQIRTEVTIYDGATVVMGGLTREEVITINDKVPVLGDIPLLGRLFQSKGQSSQKRNLLIFVTANLISPGGSPSRQEYRTVQANSLFQNPIIVTPSGAVNRGLELPQGGE